jgi:hypothetical protein
MLLKSLLLSTFILFSLNSKAGELSFNKTFIVSTTLEAQDVYERITDYENSCESGCDFNLPSIAEIRIIKDIDYTEESFYTWTFVDDFKDSKFFSSVKTKRVNDQITLTSSQVSKSEGKSLSKRTGLKSKPLLKSSVATYKIRNVDSGVEVIYSIRIKYGMALGTVSGLIKKGLERSANAIVKNLSAPY